MDFGRIDDENVAPDERFVGRSKSPSPSGSSSTPPTGLAKIYNPFGHQHIYDSPYMSAFSPNAFATPKTDKCKFKWTIDEVSKLRPAEIDENTDSQHVVDNMDPTMEVLIQKKIDRFFSEKVIIPSPLVEIKRTSLVAIPEERGASKEMVENSTQTVLSLPFDLPAHVQEALGPYFTSSDENHHHHHHHRHKQPVEGTPLYEKLFNTSVDTSPAMSTGLSPIIFSPMMDDKFDRCTSDRELPECELSPIPRESLGRSVCRLDFSMDDMSVDASRKSPDLAADGSLQPLNSSAVNWDMEFEYVSFVSPSASPDAMMDLTQLSTPHTRLFTGQRKRLSDSFLDSEGNKENEAPGPGVKTHVFASTPSTSRRY